MIDDNLKPTDRLMRYMSFEKFMDMICRKKIFVPRADMFDDDFEGNYTQLIYEIGQGISVVSDGISNNQGMVNNTKEIRESAFVSCWTTSEMESMAIWKLYGGKNSVAIETTVDALNNEIESPENRTRELRLLNKRIFKVDYIDHRSRDEILAKELMRSMYSPLTKKSIAYAYEQEVRLIIDHFNHPLAQKDLKERIGLGIDFCISPVDLINKIYVSPLADAWFFKLLEIVLKNHGLADVLSWSNMRIAPADELYL